MAAILKLPDGKLGSVLAIAAAGEVVTAANFNSPDQVVIAGHAAAVQRAADLARAAGAKRAVMLPVSAPFHCPLMKPAQDSMRPELNATDFADLRFPLINNWRARQIRSGAEAREGLIEQIPNPVLWTQTVRHLAVEGVTDFVEVGPGTVLTGLLKTIDPSLKGRKFGEASDIEKFNAAVV
jgi:[acyl-carrier-protein] S-malonyltransferase